MARPARALGEVIRNLLKKPATVLYPFVKAKIQDKFRGKIIFSPDMCIGCKLCMKDCPAKAINIIQVETAQPPAPAAGEAPKPAPRKFRCEIDLGRCIYCAQCVDSCPKKALHSSQEFELAAIDRNSLKYDERPAEK